MPGDSSTHVAPDISSDFATAAAETRSNIKYGVAHAVLSAVIAVTVLEAPTMTPALFLLGLFGAVYNAYEARKGISDGLRALKDIEDHLASIQPAASPTPSLHP